MGIKSSVVALLALVPKVVAFGVIKPLNSRAQMNRGSLSMAEDDTTTMKSLSKQIVYDEKTGRFFESNSDV